MNSSKGKSMYKNTGVKQHSVFSLEEWKFKWILWEMILRRQTGIRSGKILSILSMPSLSLHIYKLYTYYKTHRKKMYKTARLYCSNKALKILKMHHNKDLFLAHNKFHAGGRASTLTQEQSPSISAEGRHDRKRRVKWHLGS